jgi:hypothetical protein
MIPFPILHLAMTPPLLILVPFVMVPIVKMSTIMMTTKTTPLPIPLVLIMPLMAGNNHNAVGGTSNAINDCNNHNAVCGRDDDIMSLSFTNQSLQPHVSDLTLPHILAPIPIWNVMPAQKSTGMISRRIHPWTSSNKNVSRVVGSSSSITPMPH